MSHLESLGVDDWFVRAIGSHNSALGIARESAIERHLFACDELAGFVVAVAYVRPSKSLFEVEVRSVVKKLKELKFAAAVNRDEVYAGADEIGLPFEEHVGNVIMSLQDSAESLGFPGRDSVAG